jgi:hypothetical protein
MHQLKSMPAYNRFQMSKSRFGVERYNLELYSLMSIGIMWHILQIIARLRNDR